MIHSKEDLKYYLKEDNKQFGYKRPGLRDWLLHNERWYIYRFKRELRNVEYLTNIKQGGGKETYALLALFSIQKVELENEVCHITEYVRSRLTTTSLR